MNEEEAEILFTEEEEEDESSNGEEAETLFTEEEEEEEDGSSNGETTIDIGEAISICRNRMNTVLRLSSHKILWKISTRGFFC